MGNSMCSCDIKSLDKHGISFQRDSAKKVDKIEIDAISLKNEIFVKASNKFISDEKMSFIIDESNFETQIKNFAKIISAEEFESIYLSILKNANLSPLSESNNLCNELNNEDYKTHNNSESHSQDKNLFQAEFNSKKKTAIELSNDEEKRFYKGDFNAEMQKHGYGILINKDNSLYEGNWENDKACGFGRYIDGSGNYYEGQWTEGYTEGKGTFCTKDNYKYSGEWAKDLQEGFGEELQANGTIYKGEFKKGEKNGTGKINWTDGSFYEGEFSKNKIKGKGTYVWNDGRVFTGEFLDNKMHGFGTFKWPDHKVYIGNYFEDKKSGFGKYYWNENFYYEGNWMNSKQHGKGVICDDKKIIEGTFRYGKIVKIIKEELIDNNKNKNNENDNCERKKNLIDDCAEKELKAEATVEQRN